MAFDLKNYEPVDARLRRFFEDFKDSRIDIKTEIIPTPDCIKGIVFRATIQVIDLDGNCIQSATGWANEIPGQGNVNSDSVVENCETSAIGRALANLSYSGSKRPSQEEMKKVGNGSYSEPRIPGENSNIIGWGKYKGQTLSDAGLDPKFLSYCDWIIETSGDKSDKASFKKDAMKWKDTLTKA